MSLSITAVLKSWKTSVTGFVLGAVWYLYSSGAQLPQNRSDVWHLAIGVCFAGFGLVAKDGDRGKKP